MARADVCSRARLLLAISVFNHALDLVDFCLDMVFAADLAGHGGYAALMAAMAVAGVIVGAFGQYNWHYNPDTQGGEDYVLFRQVPILSSFTGHLNAGSGGNTRLLFYLVPAMAVFSLEDATTIYVWAETGTFGSDVFSVMNMSITLASAGSLAVKLLLCACKYFRSENFEGRCNVDAVAFLGIAGTALACVAFFIYAGAGAVLGAGEGGVDAGVLVAIRVMWVRCARARETPAARRPPPAGQPKGQPSAPPEQEPRRLGCRCERAPRPLPATRARGPYTRAQPTRPHAPQC